MASGGCRQTLRSGADIRGPLSYRKSMDFTDRITADVYIQEKRRSGQEIMDGIRRSVTWSFLLKSDLLRNIWLLSGKSLKFPFQSIDISGKI